MKILSLDLGTKLGWCRSVDGEIIASGHEKFKSPFHWLSYRQFYEFLCRDIFSDYHVIIEKPNTFGPGYHSKRVLFGMLGIVELFFKPEQITMISAKSAKKHMTGDGNASKEGMVASVCQTIGEEITSEDEADAISFALFYWDTIHEK